MGWDYMPPLKVLGRDTRRLCPMQLIPFNPSATRALSAVQSSMKAYLLSELNQTERTALLIPGGTAPHATIAEFTTREKRGKGDRVRAMEREM